MAARYLSSCRLLLEVFNSDKYNCIYTGGTCDGFASSFVGLNMFVHQQ